MPRYWVIAPYENKDPELFEKVWQFDLANSTISIGWSELGDISKLGHEELERAVADKYPGSPPPTKALFVNMLWRFYHEIVAGDLIIARRGIKVLAAVGRVTRPAEYAPGRNPAIKHGNFVGVEWLPGPREKVFPVAVFPMFTLAQITEPQFSNLTQGPNTPTTISEPNEATDQITLGLEGYVFVLEKYLEEFIVSNFDAVFKKKMLIYEDAEGVRGQQYPTDVGPIDILALEVDSNSLVVIELKRGRTSDQVVAQILRYMGWVKKNLCKEGQLVKGVVICRDSDAKLSYALETIRGAVGIEIKYYGVKFWLDEAPVAPPTRDA
jgi:restriction system protein